MMVHTRGAAPVAVLVDQARTRIASLDPNLPLLSAKSLADRTSASLLFFNFI